MLKIFLLTILTFALLPAIGQVQTQVIGDSVYIHANTGTSELILQNSSDTVNGFLFNRGGGRTEFRHALVKINDSTYIMGVDTLHIATNSNGSQALNGWNITGNTGMVAGTNFIGTIDNVELMFKVNNILAGRTGKGSFSNTSFGAQSQPITGTGDFNAAFGSLASANLRSGGKNTDIGYEAGYNNLTGNFNTRVGEGANIWDTSSSYNVVLGTEALNHTSLSKVPGGGFNTALGAFALNKHAIYRANIGLGYNAGNGLTGNNTLFVSDSSYHMYFKLDSSANAAPNIIGKDATGFWHVYPLPSGTGGGGGGTVTNITTGFGLLGGPITTTGAIMADTAVLHQKFLAFADSTTYYPYNSNPKGYLTSLNAWSPTGNAGTTSSNFLGTTDNKALVFKVNNIFSGFISTSPSFSSTAFGNSALNTYSTGTLTGSPNTAFGGGALTKVTSGSFNTAVGNSAGGSFTTGYYNTSIGNLANDWNQTGINNTSIGEESMGQVGSGVHNHSYNTAIGFAALADNYGNYNIGLGNRAGQNGVGDSTLFVSDSTIHMKFRLDSIAGGARNLIGKDANGYWHVYQIPAGINGGGTVTNIATGFGLLGGPITTTGSIIADTAALHQKFLGIPDSTIYYPYASNPKGYLTALNAWNTTGNAGTTTSDFIGTTDNNPLLFKVNNQLAGSILTDPNLNVSLGSLTLPISATGQNNVAIGGHAMGLATTAFGNAAIGTWALYKNATGRNNVVMGWSALSYSTADNSNVAIGYAALNFLNGGYSNTALGTSAMQNWTSGNYNIGLGNEAGYSKPNLGSNYLFISDSTYHMYMQLDSASGSAPTMIGKDANGFWHVYQIPLNATSNLQQVTDIGNTTSHDLLINNVTVGIGSGSVSTNTVLGNLALSSNTSGYYNTAIGLEALKLNTTGAYNTALGRMSLSNNTSGFDNTGIGLYALASNTSGIYNTAVGMNALYPNTTGNQNAAFGMNALRLNTTGNSNTALGDSALFYNTTGSYNIGLGKITQATVSNTFYVSDSTYHMYYKLDSVSGTAPSIIGKDANGFWHVYQAPSSAPAGITTIQEDGASLTARPTLNFNYGVTATDNSASSSTFVDVNLSTASNALTTDVSMSSGSTFYDGGSISLSAGTWLITANATIESSNNSAMKITGKIWDGTTVYGAGEGSTGSFGGGAKGYVNVSINSLVTVSSTTSIKASYASTIASCSLKAATADNNTGTSGKTTSITAVRIR